VVRRSGKPVLVAANKIDDRRSEERSEIGSVHAMGFEEVFGISASHGRGVADMLDALLVHLPDADENEADEVPDAGEDAAPAPDDGVPRIAVVGRPNAGKSTLLNRLLDDDRLVVSEIPGTTRDAIEVELTRGAQRYRFIDTAGIRRKVGHGDDLEQESAEVAEDALKRADVVIVLFDATEPAVEQDSRLLGACLKLGKPMVLAANKVDLLAGRAGRQALADAVDEHLRFVFANAPLVELSARDGVGLPKLLAVCSRLYAQSRRRIPTPEINRFLGEAEDAHPAPRHQGHPVRLYYMAQVSTRPPTFLVHVNRPAGINEAYRRFLENRMRERWGFEIPLRLVFKRRRK
jgi:GTPase